MEIYNELTYGSSSSAELEAPAGSDEPFGPLDLSKQPLFPIHPAVLDFLRKTKRCLYQEHQTGDGTETGSPQ